MQRKGVKENLTRYQVKAKTKGKLLISKGEIMNEK